MNNAELNKKMVRHSRTLTYILAAFLLVALFLKNSVSKTTDYSNLASELGILSFIFISLALSVTPIRTLFPAFVFNGTIFFARRAIGVSSFAFAALHFSLQFVFFFGSSLDALFLFNQNASNAIFFGIVSALILFFMTITSTDWAVAKLGKNWFLLHRFVYLAYPLIILHAVLIGSDFTRLSFLSGVFLLAAALTIILEAARLNKTLRQKTISINPKPEPEKPPKRNP
ncbi:MAG: ferric reductase-like transmembrane domain-containing protein [Candidatus Diapherotrites archaeon]|uniref:Ferric reductase-like transmembrane domain-containing protein n=1 Tax=Candidatus Iainarchaeum sp. TaxID=3101447 RepID=A0A8T4L531_9ARCH|nr:ferric reductase-like transmembrane domain-containing protein [Candidatus Diapherotrites archaeon]